MGALEGRRSLDELHAASRLIRGARVFFCSSSLTRIFLPESGSYASMKSAIEVLTSFLAKELEPPDRCKQVHVQSRFMALF